MYYRKFSVTLAIPMQVLQCYFHGFLCNFIVQRLMLSQFQMFSNRLHDCDFCCKKQEASHFIC